MLGYTITKRKDGEMLAETRSCAHNNIIILRVRVGEKKRKRGEAYTTIMMYEVPSENNNNQDDERLSGKWAGNGKKNKIQSDLSEMTLSPVKHHGPCYRICRHDYLFTGQVYSAGG